MKKIKSKSGFTLVELIVSLTLTAALLVSAAAILAPAGKVYANIYNMSNQQIAANILIDEIRSHFNDVHDIMICNSQTRTEVSDKDATTGEITGDTIIFNNTDTDSGIANVYYIIEKNDDNILSVRYQQKADLEKFGISGDKNTGVYVSEENAKKDFAPSKQVYVGAEIEELQFGYNPDKKYIRVQVLLHSPNCDYKAKRVDFIDVN